MKNIIRKIKVIAVGILMIISSTMIMNPSIVEADTSNGLSKTVTRVGGMLNEWEISLSVEVEPVVQKQDIIVVIDRSGSMDENSRMANAKTAAKLFVNTILDPNKIHDTRIALISYSSDVQINNGFTNNVNTLIGNINGLSADGGTFSQGALYEARNLMTTARSGAEKIIVFLSDGAPSFGYNLNTAGKLTAKTQARISSGIASPNYRLLTTNTPGGYTGANSIDGNTFYIDGGWEEGIPNGNFDYTRSTAGGNGGAAYHLMQEIEKTTGSKPKNQYLLLNLYKTLVSEAKYAKDDGSRIYSIALDLGGDAKAGQSLEKVATSPADYFVAASGNLEEKFKNIAQSIQMPLENMQVYDQMGTGFSLVAGSALVTSGSLTGLSTTETDLTWNLTPDSFTYDNVDKVYRANVIYRIRTNTDAIPLIEDTTNNPSGYLPTNESAVFTYTDKGVWGSKLFPVPEAKPTILAVVKDKYEYGSDPDDLNDFSHQRQYEYNVSSGNNVLEGDYIDNSRLKTYHILQNTTELTMNEYSIVNDNIDRFAVTYRMFNYAGESVMTNGKFTLVPETGMNTVHIENNIISLYNYDGFGITKAVVDKNENGYAELAETLTYTITIDNLEDVFIRDVHIQDTLSSVDAYLENFGSNELIVKREGVVEAIGLTVADLVTGFDMMIGGLETITLTFDVKVKASAELPEFLSNTVTVNEKSAEAEIETAIPQYTATKSVVDGNGNELAEAGEDLTYTIHVSNTGKIRLENILVKDELENIINHIQDPTDVVVTIGSDTYTLAQLASGILINLDAGMSEDVIFTVTLLQDFNAKLVGKLKNIASVNELNPEAEIDTGYFTLAATKSVLDGNGNQKAEAGEALTYTISVRNTGTTTANGVFIKDGLEDLIDHIKDPASVKVDVGGVEYALANLQAGFNVDLAANELLDIVFTVILKDDFDAMSNPVLRNIATVGDENPGTEIPTGKYVLAATKDVVDANEDGYVEAGEDFMYTITITNSGDVLAKDVLVKDDLATIIGHIKNPEDVVVMIGSNNYTLDQLAAGIKIDLAAGESKEVKFKLTLIDDFDADATPILENVATVNNLNPDAEIPTGQALLEASKTVIDANGDGFAEAGEALTYTITAINNGNIAKNGITIKDGLTELYAHIKSPSAVVVYLDNDGSLETLTLFDLMGGITQNLGAGKSLTLTFTVIVKDDFDAGQIDKLTNIAAVHDLTPGTEIPTGRAIIGAEKAVDDENGDGFAEAGEALTYTITVGNAGNVKANNVLIKDELLDFEGIIKNPSAVKVMVGTTEYSLAQLNAGILVDLDAGENLVVEFTITLKDDFDAASNLVLENIATVGPEEPTTEIPTGKAKFIADKTVVDANQDGLAEAGEELTYTISLKNIGNVKAKDVLIKDNLANLMDHIKDPAAVKVMVGTDEHTLAQLKAGILVDLGVNESLNVVFTVTLKDDFDAAEFTSLYNIATVADKNPDVTIDTGKADFEASKMVVDENEDGLAEAGEALTYTLSLKNIGTVKAYDVLIQDELVNLYMHIKEPTLVRVSDGSREYTLAELMNGFEVDLDVNETLTFEFTITLKDAFDASEFPSLYNIATLADKNPDAEIDTGKAILVADKHVADANEDGFAEAGEELTYTISVQNTGNVKAVGVEIKDEMTNLIDHIKDPSLVIFTIKGADYTLANLMAGIEVDLEVNEILNVSFTVTIKNDFDADENPVLKNIATVGDEEPEIEIPTGKAIISANKDVVDASEDGFVEAGENFTYTITISNTGNVKAMDVLIKDELANIKGFIKDPDAVVVMIGLNDYTLDELEAGITIDLDAGKTVRVKFTLTLRDEFEAREITNLENIAQVNELTPEAEIPTGYSYLEANKTVEDANRDGFAEAGEALTYTIKATNSGNVVKKNILIKDDLANLFAHIDNPASVNVYLDNNGTLETLNLSDLMSGITRDLDAETSMTLVFTVVLKDDFDASEIKELLNIAAVHDLEPEVEIPTGLAILGADKFVSDENEDGFAEAGETLTYTISVKNTGNVKARDVIIKDDLTGIIEHIKNPEDVKVWIRESVYTLEELSAGILVYVNVEELLEVWFTVTLKDDFDADEFTILRNIATVGNDEPEVEIPTGKAKIEADKKVVDGNKNGYAEAGEALTYTITVKNTGQVKAKDVLMKDDLADMVNHIQDPTAVKVMVGETEYTLAELMAGILVDMDAGENMKVEFTLILKDDFDAKKTLTLKNIAAIGDETPKAEIPTGYYEIKADKRVNDANGDGYAEAGEKLTYTIMVLNDGNVMVKGVKVQDDLANLLEHLKDYTSVVVKVGEQEYSLEDLINGLEFDLDADEFIELVFTVELKDNFDAKKVKYLMNIAKVNDLRPEAEIETFAKTKFVLGEKLPDPEKPKEAAPKPILPQTGQSNKLVVSATFLVLIGLGLVLRKREEDE